MVAPEQVDFTKYDWVDFAFATLDQSIHLFFDNSYWARCTRIFGKIDIGGVEREFLDVLDWELGLTENDLLAYLTIC
jgi:hypothetical protein